MVGFQKSYYNTNYIFNLQTTRSQHNVTIMTSGPNEEEHIEEKREEEEEKQNHRFFRKKSNHRKLTSAPSHETRPNSRPNVPYRAR